jgi:integrase
MASISRDKNQTKRILFVDGDHKRWTVRLGKTPVKTAESVKLRVEALLSCQVTGTPHDAELSAWVRDLPDDLHAKIAKTGLLEPRERTAATVGALLVNYFATIDVKDSTRTRNKQTERLLIEHFGEHRALRTIRRVDCDHWRAWLVEKKYAAAKVAKEVNIARQIFKKAVLWEMIQGNPFEGVRAGSQCNPARLHFVSIEDTARLIEAAGSADWRCIIALARFGGLRCPSEVLRLRWADVLWDSDRMRVESPKTEHHSGKGERVIPLFPELRAVLLEAFGEAEPGAVYVVGRYRDEIHMNLRTQFERIIDRAGLVKWPRLFNALRASRATELAAQHPGAVCSAWMGHSVAVAEAHYQMVRDTDYERAATTPTMGGAKCGALVAQNAAQSPTGNLSHVSSTRAQVSKKTSNRPAMTEHDGSCKKSKVGPEGLEPSIPFGKRILSPPRMPIPPRALGPTIVANFPPIP